MNIYILTSDKNVHVVEGLQYCVNKYWKPNPNVIILGYKEPKFEFDSNFTFVSLGEDRGAGKVGEDIINYFTKISDKYFIFSVDDFFPIREVNVDMFNNLVNGEKYALLHVYEDFGDINLFIAASDQDKNSYLSITTANSAPENIHIEIAPDPHSEGGEELMYTNYTTQTGVSAETIFGWEVSGFEYPWEFYIRDYRHIGF